MIDYELILILSAAGFMWSEVLTREGMIFGWFPSLVVKVIGTKEVRDELGGFLRLEHKRKSLLFIEKPLYSCAICVTGFWSLVLLLVFGVELPLVYSLLSMLLTKILLRYA